MQIESIYRNYQRLINDNLSFIYQGNFSDDVTEQLIGLSEHNLDNMTGLSKMKRRASFLMIECFQNVIRHGERIDDNTVIPTHDGLYVTRNIGHRYYIASANAVPNSFIPELEEKLNAVNKLNKHELKQRYLEVLTNDSLSKKGGAGLGLIEMARKSGQPLDYIFEKIDDDKSYFYLQVQLEKPQEIECQTPADPLDVTISHDFNVEMKKDHVFMVHKGNFSTDSVSHVLEMIERNMADQIETNQHKKRVFQSLVEIMQNVTRHCKVVDGLREGVFQMGKRDGTYTIATGNLVHKKDQDRITTAMQHILPLNPAERKELYLENLKEEARKGFGLVDISRFAQSMEYDFKAVSPDTSFFSILVRV